MKTKLVIVLLGIYFFTAHLGAKNYDAYGNDSIKQTVRDTLHDTIYVSNMGDVKKIFGMSFDEYAKEFLLVASQRDTLKKESPERIYLNYLLPALSNDSTFLSQRYVVRNYLLKNKNKVYVLKQHFLSLPDSALLKRLNLDVMMTCYGDENTRDFLRSPNYQKTCLEQLFMSINDSKDDIKGLNFYFPNFDFKEKRAMAQFVKSASLVIDSSHITEINKLRLYVSFDKKAASKDLDYCYCLAQMTDSVMLVRNPNASNDSMSISTIDVSGSNKLSLYTKIVNQLYLARYFTATFPKTRYDKLTSKDLMAIMSSDYEYNTWEEFMFGLFAIAAIIIIFVILYCTVVSFAFYINKNRDFLFIFILMLLLEIFLLFFSMIEAMSKENVFVFSGDGRNELLLLPLALIFIIPLMKMLGGRGEKP